MNAKRIASLLLLVVITCSVLLGCQRPVPENAGTETGSQTGTAVQTDAATQGKPSVIFIVTGQLGDKSFNDSAAAGVNEMTEKLGIETVIKEIGRDQTLWETTFMDVAESGKYDIIITNGSSSRETVESVAVEFPDQKFIVFDTELEKSKFPNIYAISYKQNEGSYLAGVLAALVTTSDMEYANPDKIIGFIGGSEHPIISDFLVGYIAGAQSVDPDVKVLVSYIGSWDDTARGKETALAQFAQGADIVFPAAEQAGLGCVEAAVEKNKYIIGVDSDQAMLFKGVDEAKANVILTSVLKEVGNSLVRAVDLDMQDKLLWGDFESLGLAENGVGLAQNEYYDKNVPQDIKDKVEEAYAGIDNVKIPTALGVPVEEVDKIINSAKP